MTNQKMKPGNDNSMLIPGISGSPRKDWERSLLVRGITYQDEELDKMGIIRIHNELDTMYMDDSLTEEDIWDEAYHRLVKLLHHASRARNEAYDNTKRISGDIKMMKVYNVRTDGYEFKLTLSAIEFASPLAERVYMIGSGVWNSDITRERIMTKEYFLPLLN